MIPFIIISRKIQFLVMHGQTEIKYPFFSQQSGGGVQLAPTHQSTNKKKQEFSRKCESAIPYTLYNSLFVNLSLLKGCFLYQQGFHPEYTDLSFKTNITSIDFHMQGIFYQLAHYLTNCEYFIFVYRYSSYNYELVTTDNHFCS